MVRDSNTRPAVVPVINLSSLSLRLLQYELRPYMILPHSNSCSHLDDFISLVEP